MSCCSSPGFFGIYCIQYSSPDITEYLYNNIHNLKREIIVLVLVGTLISIIDIGYEYNSSLVVLVCNYYTYSPCR